MTRESLRATASDIRAITFDFGNTLVRVDRAGHERLVRDTADLLVRRGIVRSPEAFLAGWVTERDRQFRLQVPRLLEVDLAERVGHVLAGLRGVPIPADDAEPWDEAAVGACVDPAEVALGVDSYSRGFVAAVRPIDDADATLREARDAGFRLGILSNWPLALTVDRYVEARGWTPLFDAIVVSQRIGVIKPHRAIFEAAAAALGLPPSAILHVGDDWAADVVGAKRAGWHVAYLRGHQGDTPLPTSSPDANDGPGIRPDLEIDRLADLLPALGART